MDSYLMLCTQAYDIDKPTAPAGALAFYERYAREAGGPILEPMCGSGRFLVPLLEGGHDIDGVDASPHMLGACKQRCENLGLTPILYEQFLHQLELPRYYRFVFIAAGSFGLITDMDEVRESLRRIHASMDEGATLVLEAERPRSPRSHSWPWGGKWWIRPDGARIVFSWVGHYDADERVDHSVHRYELVRNGQLLETEFENFDLRYYEPPELRELLLEAGFVNVEVPKFGSPADVDSDEEFVFECTRP